MSGSSHRYISFIVALASALTPQPLKKVPRAVDEAPTSTVANLAAQGGQRQSLQEFVAELVASVTWAALPEHCCDDLSVPSLSGCWSDV